ncbi:hypothetical protein ABZW10_33740 [Kitasatospora sp. NPDC004723]|uniref:hypothetical protein n=1 Tax=Kitasatospora sp. NPDC004723 TaxID=3154288 RepID=UPI0033B3B6E1
MTGQQATAADTRAALDAAEKFLFHESYAADAALKAARQRAESARQRWADVRGGEPVTVGEALAVGVHVRAEFGRLCKQGPHPKDLTAMAERLNGARADLEAVRRGMLALGHAWPTGPLLPESG